MRSSHVPEDHDLPQQGGGRARDWRHHGLSGRSCIAIGQGGLRFVKKGIGEARQL
jgi:hypothetical protein